VHTQFGELQSHQEQGNNNSPASLTRHSKLRALSRETSLQYGLPSLSSDGQAPLSEEQVQEPVIEEKHIQGSEQGSSYNASDGAQRQSVSPSPSPSPLPLVLSADVADVGSAVADGTGTGTGSEGTGSHNNITSSVERLSWVSLSLPPLVSSTSLQPLVERNTGNDNGNDNGSLATSTDTNANIPSNSFVPDAISGAINLPDDPLVHLSDRDQC
jgi:hypothetical protein